MALPLMRLWSLWGLRVLLVFACLGTAISHTAATEPTPVAPIPPASDLVVCLELRRLLNSPLGRSHFKPVLEQAQGADHRLVDVLNRLEIDLRRDIDRLVWAVSSTQPDRGWIVLQGRFEPENIQDRARQWAAQQPDAIRQRSLGEDIYYETVGSPPIFLQVIDEQTLVLSSHREWVKERVTWGRPNPKLIRGLERTTQGDGGWLVALPAALALVPTADESQRQSLERIDSVVGQLRVDSTLRCEIRLDTADPNVATGEVQPAIRQSFDVVKRWRDRLAQEWPTLLPLLDWLATFRVTTRGPQVVLSSELSARRVADLLRPWRKNDDQ